MEGIALLFVAVVVILIWRFGKTPPTPKPKTPPESVPAPLEVAKPEPAAPPSPRRELPPSMNYLPEVDDDKSTGRRELRRLCRVALEDKAITLEEATALHEAFAAYCHRFPNTSAHVEYLRSQLGFAIEDGVIDKDENHELVTSLGEFADFGLYGPVPAAPAAPSRGRDPTPTPRKRKAPTAPTAPAALEKSKRPRVIAPQIQTDGIYLLSYVGSEGEPSERKIKAKRVEMRGDHLYLVAYCLTARGPRTFRVDRIESMVDAETGEYIVL